MAETVLLYVYTSTPLQQYQYVPKETVRHQASCEEVVYIHTYIPYHLQLGVEVVCLFLP